MRILIALSSHSLQFSTSPYDVATQPYVQTLTERTSAQAVALQCGNDITLSALYRAIDSKRSKAIGQVGT